MERVRKLNKAQLIENLRHGVYARLMPSPTGGVGVFAIRDIPAGINPFGEEDMPFEKIPVKEIFDDPEIPDAVKKYAGDMFAIEDGYIYITSGGLNNINPSFFINHSETPNLKTDDSGANFIAQRVIATGEELTIDYRTYNDNLGF